MFRVANSSERYATKVGGGRGRRGEVTGRFSRDPSRICLGTWKKRGLG